MADPLFPLNGKKIWVAGETGMVGRALLRQLKAHSVTLLSAPHSALDLTDQAATYDWVRINKPDAIIVAAGKVGGIGANAAYPADFLRDNLLMAANVIEAARLSGVQRLLYLGSSCIYPKMAAQPINKDALLTGALEETNEAYAIAKIAGLKLCQHYRTQYGLDYISAMPTNLYGPDDHFDLEKSHVLPALMMRFHRAKIAGQEEVVLWGTGAPLREFLHVDDLASALLVMLEKYNGVGPLNIGSGEEVSIAALASLMADITGYKGRIRFDSSKPDGTPRKFLDSSRIRALGWSPSMALTPGLRSTYEWYCQREENCRAA